MERDAYFDNARFILIVLVVLGHGMEIVSGNFISTLYWFIYLFHMPAFIFISGYFAGRQKQQKVGNLFLQYLLFQTLYIFFEGFIEGLPLGALEFRYTIPRWILWFSFALIIWRLVIPFVSKLPMWAAVTLSVLWALAMGLFPDINYSFSASRVSVFFPFFVLGFYCKDKHIAAIRKVPKVVGLGVFFFSYVLLRNLLAKLPREFFFGSYGYTGLEMGRRQATFTRFGIMLWGFVLVLALLVCIPSKRIPLVTACGKNTMQVYYLHGFFMIWAAKYAAPIMPNHWAAKLLFFVCLLALTFLLSSKPVNWLMKPILDPIYYVKKIFGPKARTQQSGTV